MRTIGDIILAGFGQFKNARIENLAVDPAVPQVGQIWFNTTDNVYRGYNGTAIISFATGGSTALILAEIDQIEASAGLDADGKYVVPVGSAYLGATSTLSGADFALDAALKAVSDALASEVSRATTADSTNTQAITDEVTRATAAEGANATAIAAEVTRATGVEQGIDARVVTIEGSYIKKDGSVAFLGAQSMGSHKITDLSNPEAAGDAANKSYVDSKISGLGNAFAYVGVIIGGVDAANAFDLATLTTKTAGSFYKVATGGYFKLDTGDAFVLNAKDGLVFNLDGGVDKIDNTDSEVMGTTNFIEVTGSTDAGFTVTIAENFKTRVSTLETGLSDEILRVTGINTALTQAIADEATTARAAEDANATAIAAEVTRATGVEGTIQTELDLIELSVGLGADGGFTQLTTSNYLNAATSVVGLSVALDTTVKALADRVAGSTVVVDSPVAATTHTIVHGLGQKYCNVTVVDSADKVFIPDEIVYVDINTLTVSVASAMTLKAIVTGAKA